MNGLLMQLTTGDQFPYKVVPSSGPEMNSTSVVRELNKICIADFLNRIVLTTPMLMH